MAALVAKYLDPAAYAVVNGAVEETQALQDALDMHVCNLNTGLIYVAREYLYKWVSSLPLSAPGVDASRHRYRLAERR